MLKYRDQIIINEEQKIVYILNFVDAPRSINAKTKRKAKEVIIQGMSLDNFKKIYPELYAAVYT